MRPAVALLLGIAACRGGGKQHREGSAAPVEVVNQPIDGRGAAGPTGDEIEPNDGVDNATPLALGATMRGRIDPDSDVDHYRIDVGQAGALAVMLSGVEGVDLVLEIEDSSGNVIAKSDRGAARIKEGVPNLGVTPGRYTAVVRKKVKPPPKGARPPKNPEPSGAAPVWISAAAAPFGPNAEREPDDDRGTANDPSSATRSPASSAGRDATSGSCRSALSAKNALTSRSRRWRASRCHSRSPTVGGAGDSQAPRGTSLVGAA
jgi:hypothetical protein